MSSLLFEIKLKRENKVYYENVSKYLVLVYSLLNFSLTGHAFGLRAVPMQPRNET